MPEPDTVNESDAAARSKVLGTRVPEAFYDEFDVIRRQRREDSMSDTVRAALQEFAARHWETKNRRIS